MKILAVTFDSEMAGGANRSFMMVIKNLRTQFNHDIHVIVPKYGPIEQALEKELFSYEVMPLNMKLVLLNGTKKDILRKIKANLIALNLFVQAFKERKRLKAYGFDLVYVNCANQLFGGFIAKLLNIPCVWHFRGRFDERVYYLHNHQKFYGEKTSEIIVISKQMYETVPQLLGVPKEKFHMIHNGMENTVTHLSRQDRTNGVHAVICGRITSLKGQGEAIEAVKLLKQAGYEVFLHIAGSLSAASMNYLHFLKQKIADNNLGENIIFEDQVSDMSTFRENMNIELMCAECEPFGRVTVEGMRSGLVVIGANTGGTVDIIEDGVNGLLYQQGNPSDLAEKIKCIIDDPSLAERLIKNGIAFSNTHFTVEENVRQINAVLEKAVKNKEQA